MGNESPANPLRNADSVSPGTSYTAARMSGPSEFVRNWVELRLLGQQPDRRSYHSSFVFDKKLFVFGGLDIREGSLNSLFELNLQCLGEIDPELVKIADAVIDLISLSTRPHSHVRLLSI